MIEQPKNTPGKGELEIDNDSDIIELYLSLLTNEDADNIIYYFADPVPGYYKTQKQPTLDIKKSHIRRIFEGKTKKSKNIPLPFLNYIYHHYQDETLSQFPFDQFIEFMNLRRLLPTDAELFACVCANFDLKELEKHLNKMVTRFKNGLPIFQDIEFPTEETLIEHIKTTSIYLDDSFVEFVCNVYYVCVVDGIEENANELKETLKDLKLHEFWKRRALNTVETVAFYNYVYLMIHPELDGKVRIHLATEILYNMLISDRVGQKEMYTQLLELLRKESEFNVINDQKIEVVQKLKETESTLKIITKEKQQITKDFKSLNQKYENLLKKMEQQKLNWEEERKQYETSYSRVDEPITTDEQGINDKNATLMLAVAAFSESSEEQTEIEMAVIYTGEFEICQPFFPEALGLPLSSWKNQKQQLIKLGVEHIIIQRDGMDTGVFMDIVQFVRKHNISFETFFASNSKQMLESIAYYKYKFRRA